MQAITISGKSTTEIQSALEQQLSNARLPDGQGFDPTLAIVFMSFKLDISGICSLMNKHEIQVFGATSSGEFINRDILEGSIVVMLLDMNPDYFRLVFMETLDHSDFETAKLMGSKGKEIFTNPAFILTSGWVNDIDGESIIAGIEAGFGAEVAIYGGMAGDDLTLIGPAVFTYGKQSTTGLLALIVDQNKVDVAGVATCGWKPVGISKTITKSKGNIVYTIDDKPALDTVMKYLGLSLSDEPLNNTVFNLGAYYPLQLERANAPAVMRTAMLGNIEDRSLVCAGHIPQGSKVRFSLPPDFDVIDTVVEDCVEVREKYLQEADAMIMFSCVSRYLSFGLMSGEEIEQVQNVWNAPMIGFFTYGEYGKSKGGKHEFHNNTCSVLTLKEK